MLTEHLRRVMKQTPTPPDAEQDADAEQIELDIVERERIIRQLADPNEKIHL